MIEKLETLNQRLIDVYGVYTGGEPRYRIVFSDDEIEKRWSKYTKEGLELQHPILVELPKYRQWINPPCYVLEQLTEIPEEMLTDLTVKLSYEPIWVFRDGNHNPVIPVWAAIQLLVNQVLENIHEGKKREYRAYKDPREQLTDPKIAIEAREKQLQELQDALFGSETDNLAYDKGIVVPHNYEKPRVN